MGSAVEDKTIAIFIFVFSTRKANTKTVVPTIPKIIKRTKRGRREVRIVISFKPSKILTRSSSICPTSKAPPMLPTTANTRSNIENCRLFTVKFSHICCQIANSAYFGRSCCRWPVANPSFVLFKPTIYHFSESKSGIIIYFS